MRIEKSETGNMNQTEHTMAAENSLISIVVLIAPIIIEHLSQQDFGAYTLVVGAVLSGITYYAKEKWNITLVKNDK